MGGGFGGVVGWHRPWFTVRDARGRLRRLRATEAASALDYDPCRFRDPREFYYDWCAVKPYLSAGWMEDLAEY